MAGFSWSQGDHYESYPHNTSNTREVIYRISLSNDGGVTADYTCRLYAKLDGIAGTPVRDTVTLTLDGSTGKGSATLRYRIPSDSTALITDSYFTVDLDGLFEPADVQGSARFEP